MVYRIDLNLGRTGSESDVLLDGQNISKGLKGVWVGTEVGEPTRVELLLVAPTVEGHVEGGEVRWIHPDCAHCCGHREKP